MFRPRLPGALSIALFAWTGVFAPPVPAATPQSVVADTLEHRVRLVRLVSGLERPWGLAFLPDGAMLVTERPGRLRYVDPAGRLDPMPVRGVPSVDGHAEGQGGLLDVALHPAFATNRWVYFAYVRREWWRWYGTEIARARLVGAPGAFRLEGLEVLFRARPKSVNDYHFGSRIVFDGRGAMYVTLGELGEKSPAQDLSKHHGKVVRLTEDGKPAPGNPFASTRGARPEIWSLGHRNVQGAALHPRTGELWIAEHGPQGGDELNRVRAGANYGWPIVSHGVDYRTGKPIGEGTHKAGMEQPVRHWSPSPAVSGLAFYDGARFARWRGDVLVGALAGQAVIRVRLDGDRFVSDEVMFKGLLPRVRDVRVGPDGLAYLLTDVPDGAIVRLEPAD